MKKIIGLILTLAIIASVSVWAMPVSATGTVTPSVSLSSATTTVGNQVKVTVKYTSGEDIGSWRFYLTYDTKYLQYVSGGDGGAGGKVSFVDAPESPKKTVSYTVTFKTLKVGDTTVKTDTDQIVNNNDFTNMTLSGEASKTVKIAAKPQASTDNTLKKLSISPAGLSPDFSSSKTEYTAEVDFSTAKLVVSATPNHSEASVSVSGADKLSVGENKVKITVTAESGAKKTYTITVTRKSSDLAGVTTAIDGVEYYFGYDMDKIKAPEGFTQSAGQFEGRDIITFVAPNTQLTIVCLVDGEGENKWFTFEPETQKLASYVEVKSGNNRYAVLDKPTDVTLPDGFEDRPTEVTVAGVAVKAYTATSTDMSDYCLIYAMNINGKKGLYVYDAAEDTLQRFASFGAVAADTPPSDSDTPAALPSGIRTVMIFVIAGVMLLGGVVLLVAVLKKPSEPENGKD